MNRILKNTAAIAFLMSASGIVSADMVPAEQVAGHGIAQEAVNAAAYLARDYWHDVRAHVLTDTVIDSVDFGLKAALGVLGIYLGSSLIKKHLLEQKIAEAGEDLFEQAQYLFEQAEEFQVKAGECEAKAQKLDLARYLADYNGIEAKLVEQIDRDAKNARAEGIGYIKLADSLRCDAKRRLSTRAALLGLR